ncbi:MAG: threonine/serine exporter family protein [Rikenellaceae bacterium]
MAHDIIIALLTDALFSALAAIGFAVISSPPKRAVATSALLSAIGHSFRYFLMHVVELDIASATFFASFLIGSMSFIFANLIHCPNEVFTFPSLLPMVPGLYAYNMFLSLTKFIRSDNISDNFELIESAVTNGMIAAFVLMALVLGVSLPVMLFHKASFKVTRAPKEVFARFKVKTE